MHSRLRMTDEQRDRAWNRVADEMRAAKTDRTGKMLDITCSAFGTAMLAWSIAFALHFLGFEDGFGWMGAIALLWSTISFGCLIVCGAIWVKRHVRVTII